MTPEHLDHAARTQGLRLRGVLSPEPNDGLSSDMRSVVLLGPDEPRFWPLFEASTEARDGAPDPLDRWSKRVIGALAHDWGGQAVFPADGPPYPPFLRWAEASGQCWPSPVGLLVHDAAGLMISFRGAVALAQALSRPELQPKPCHTCAKPCLTACPVGALGEGHAYDVPRCQAHVASDDGIACRSGCLVRRACPVARDFSRLPAQSAFHMAAFMRNYPGFTADPTD